MMQLLSMLAATALTALCLRWRRRWWTPLPRRYYETDWRQATASAT